MDLTTGAAASDLTRVVERVLSATFHEPVSVDAGHLLPERTNVFRFNVHASSSHTPPSVIAKLPPDWQPYDPDTTEFRAPAWFLFNNWAGAQFLQAVVTGTPLSPRVYGGDRTAGLVLIEDFGDGSGLHEVLLGSDAATAEASLLQFAALLGRLHAQTIGREEEYARLRDALGPRAHTTYFTYDWLREAWTAAIDTLGLSAATGWQSELETLIAAMRDPGPFRAYTHGDPCPDNVLRVDGDLRLIDFDAGAYRHALTDGVYGRLHFPTCWCVNRLPAQLPDAMEGVYRAELMLGCPHAADDTLFAQAVVDACTYWIITMFRLRPIADLLAEDARWGIATVRQRYLLRLPIVAQLMEQHGHLEALGTTLRALAARLRALWPEAAEELPVYAAFR